MNNISENMSIISILLLATLLFFVAGCQQDSIGESPAAVGPGYRDITAAELQSLMEEEEDDLLLVDVREPHEYNQGHIPGSILLPLGQLKDAHEETLDREKTIVLICRSGRRSAEAAIFLSEEGYKSLYNLKGGMLGWPGPVERMTFRGG